MFRDSQGYTLGAVLNIDIECKLDIEGLHLGQPLCWVV